jgi:hypothetical protein
VEQYFRDDKGNFTLPDSMNVFVLQVEEEFLISAEA